MVIGFLAAEDVIGTASNQCDNMAGTCIRERQQAAIFAFRLACLLAALVPFGVIVRTLLGRPPRHRMLLALTFAALAAVSVAALHLQPVDHLNNRWDGWLHD